MEFMKGDSEQGEAGKERDSSPVDKEMPDPSPKRRNGFPSHSPRKKNSGNGVQGLKTRKSWVQAIQGIRCFKWKTSKAMIEEVLELQERFS